ncbi:uncharacterized protein SOCG_00388 [Schizosaccharomyces octosporus yFS286]|uniref:Uncharacterized protein n=1 Tax=Schizosaccharomyces octosporus (strain yFS286) TaxID=483514 RepID=S9R2N6_SCHOY|nr:uncharacterized protein SOCG_00388 [Schizosaccharomyces octosporus yFS286]EPX72625.1 hypothetical protein SOCG_00388 [Schizosaccharomyces octosporus yFS286]
MNLKVLNRALDHPTYDSEEEEHHAELSNYIPSSQLVLREEDFCSVWKSSNCHESTPSLSRGDLTRQLLRDTMIPVPSKFSKYHKGLLSKNSNKNLLRADLNSMLSLSSQPLHNDDEFAFPFGFQHLASNSASTSTNNYRKHLALDNPCNFNSRARGLTNRKLDSEINRTSSKSSNYFLNFVTSKAIKGAHNCLVFEAADNDHPLATALESNHRVLPVPSYPSSFPSGPSNSCGKSTCTSRNTKPLRKRSLLSDLSIVSVKFREKISFFTSSIFGIMYPKHISKEQVANSTVASPNGRTELDKDNMCMENCILHTFSSSDTPLIPWHEVLARREVRRPRLNSDFFRVYVLERQMRKAGKLSSNSAGRAQFISHPKPNMINMFSSPLQIQL